MKKFLLVLPVILLVAAGCSSSQPISQTQPTQQQQVTQNPTPTPTTTSNQQSGSFPNSTFYKNNKFGFSFYYPNGYITNADDTNRVYNLQNSDYSVTYHIGVYDNSPDRCASAATRAKYQIKQDNCGITQQDFDKFVNRSIQDIVNRLVCNKDRDFCTYDFVIGNTLYDFSQTPADIGDGYTTFVNIIHSFRNK